MSDETKVPSLPSLNGISDAATRTFLMAVKELMEVRDGRRGKALDRFVTLRELDTAGVVSVKEPSTGSKLLVLSGDGGLDYSTPPALTGFAVTGGYAQMFLAWDAPQYSSFSYVEIWRSATDQIGTADMIGQTAASVYSDSCGTQAQFYYWVRAVSKAGVNGAYQAVNGVFGKTSDDVEYLIDQLTELTPEDPNRQLFEVKEPTTITQTDGTQVLVPAGVYIKTARIANASITNAKIGNAAIDNAKIASLSAAKVQFGEMSGDRIAVDSLRADRIRTDTLAAKLAVITDAYIQTANITNGVITSAKIQDAAISTAKIQDAAISTAKIQDAAISTAKIQDATISSAKIQDAAISTAKIGTAQVNTLQIAGNAVTAAQAGYGYSAWVDLQGGGAVIIFTVTAYMSDYSASATLKINGAEVASISCGGHANNGVTFSGSFPMTLIYGLTGTNYGTSISVTVSDGPISYSGPMFAIFSGKR